MNNLSRIIAISIVVGLPLMLQSKTPVNEFFDNTPDTTGPEAVLIQPFHLDIVPPSSGVQFYRNGIIFLSFSKGDERVPEKHLSFGTVKTFMALVTDSVPGPYMPFLTTSPLIFPSEATTFTPDFNTMYLSLIPEKGKNEKIFKALYGQKGWVIDNKPLNFCSDNFIYTHPCLSADGNFLVFSSDQAGSLGGLDLFITRQENGQWTDPKNIGKEINTSGNELFASLDSENNLYFSSDGHQGKGGYDIYVCHYNGTGWDKPINLPGAINTKDDELAFTVNRADNKTAFYASRTRSGKYRSQLYIISSAADADSKDNGSITQQFLALSGLKEPTSGPEKKPVPVITMTETLNKEDVKDVPVDNKPVAVISQPSVQTPEAKKEVEPAAKIVQPAQAPEIKKEEVIYRVQILANTRPVGSYNVVVAGKTYKSFEYLYQGGYRTTIGAFSTLSEATRLQNICRQNGYSQSFVVAFKNNVRSNDPGLFK